MFLCVFETKKKADALHNSTSERLLLYALSRYSTVFNILELD